MNRADSLGVLFQIAMLLAVGLWLFTFGYWFLLERNTAEKLGRAAALSQTPVRAIERCVPLLTARSHDASSRSDAARVRECFPLAREARHG